MQGRFLLRRLGMLVVAGFLIGAAATTAAFPGSAAAAPRSDRHCVTRITPLRPGERSSKVTPVTCFTTFGEALTFATRGAVQRPNVRPDQLRDTDLQAATTTVISIDFQDIGFSGSTLIWTTDVGAGCEAYTFSAASMPPGWNDVVSSSFAYANCNNNLLYEHFSFGGASVNCFSACGYVGDAMNDRTSSRIWFF